MKGLDVVLAKYPFPDGTRVAAAGGVVRRLHDRLARVAVEGPLQGARLARRRLRPDAACTARPRSSGFPKHDFGGTPWTNRDGATRSGRRTVRAASSASTRRRRSSSAASSTIRVPYTQSLEFFTALQRQDVPSKLIVFPDEGHWILKPQNSVFWYGQVLAWMKKYSEIGNRESGIGNREWASTARPSRARRCRACRRRAGPSATRPA